MTVSTLPDELRLTHLKQLEAEAIHIMREVVAQFERPVMLYSIGKDSSVLLHLARKAFFPGPLPFPLVHVNTTWKFREMIEFRDRIVQELGLELISWTNQEGIEKGINPFDHGSKNYTDIMKTQALKQALDGGPKAVAFKSLDETKIILQLFSDNDVGNFEIEIPQGTTSIEHYITSDVVNDNFRLITNETYDLNENYISSNISAMSMHSYVFTIDTSLSSQDEYDSIEESKILVFPNPAKAQLELYFPRLQKREIIIYQLNGTQVFNKKYQATKHLSIDVKSLSDGMYLIKSITNSGQQITKFLIEN